MGITHIKIKYLDLSNCLLLSINSETELPTQEADEWGLGIEFTAQPWCLAANLVLASTNGHRVSFLSELPSPQQRPDWIIHSL